MASILEEINGARREIETPLEFGQPVRRYLSDEGHAVHVYEYAGDENGVRVYRHVSTEAK